MKGANGTGLPAVLTFEHTEIRIVDRDGQPWVTAGDLARALGYRDDRSVTRIYRRNADEFTAGLSVVVNLTTTGPVPTETRLFSARGCHLVAMFARTARAKAFRRWVLDVLDAVVRPAVLPAPARPAGLDLTLLSPGDRRVAAAIAAEPALAVDPAALARRLGKDRRSVERVLRLIAALGGAAPPPAGPPRTAIALPPARLPHGTADLLSRIADEAGGFEQRLRGLAADAARVEAGALPPAALAEALRDYAAAPRWGAYRVAGLARQAAGACHHA